MSDGGPAYPIDRNKELEALLRGSCDEEHARWVEATEWKLRAEAADAQVRELLEDNARGAAYIAHLKTRLRSVIEAGDAMAKLAGYVSPPLEGTAARQQGGAE